MQKFFLLIMIVSSILTMSIVGMEPEEGSRQAAGDSTALTSASSAMTQQAERRAEHFDLTHEKFKPTPIPLVRIPLDSRLEIYLGENRLSAQQTRVFQNLVGNPEQHDDQKDSEQNRCIMYSITLDNLAHTLLIANPQFFLQLLTADAKKEITSNEFFANPTRYLLLLLQQDLQKFIKSTDDTIQGSTNTQLLLRLYNKLEKRHDLDSNGKSNAQENAQGLKTYLESRQNILKRNYKKLMAGFCAFGVAVGIYLRPWLETCIAGTLTLLRESTWQALLYIKDKTGR